MENNQRMNYIKIDDKKREEYKQTQLTAGAAITISAMVIIQCLNLEKLEMALTISVYCFSFVIPVYATLYIIHYENLKQEYRLEMEPRYMMFLSVPVGITFTIGVASIFFHFSWLVGIIFLFEVILSFTISLKYDSDLKLGN